MGWLTSIARDDRVIIASLSAGAVGLVLMMRTILRSYRDDAEVKPVQPKTQYITQDTEDALKPTTLDTLLGHYNYAIRETAGKIVCDRAINDPTTVETLLYGITRPDYDERMKNLRCLAIITDHQNLYILHTWKAYAALVRSLELGLDPDRSSQDKLGDKYFDNYFLRDMSDKLSLMFINQLLTQYDAEKLIKANFIEKWLAKQYWGDSEEEIVANFAQYMNGRSNRIAEIANKILQCQSGRERLKRAGLLTSISGDSCEPFGRFSMVPSVSRNNEDGDEQGERLVGVRQHEQSAEEQRLRHRHREAMVFNDGTRPLNSEDIIQRDHGSPT